MLATITKIGSTITKNDNVIVTISISDGFTKIFGIEKPKKKSFLLSVPASAAAVLTLGMEEDVNLTAFEQVERTWEDEDGKVVSNIWLHAKI
tara:strand:+ start:1494 stop:1769 length:276 start_codon:yes stop_codon:yes gene_type:complete